MNTPNVVVIDKLSHDGRGIAHIDGKTLFVEGGLPQESVRFVYQKRRSKFDEGTVVEVTLPSKDRVVPKCEYFGTCGGCSLQHLSSEAQVAHKEGVLIEQLRHFGKVEPETILEPLTSPSWGYRRKARLGVRYVTKKHKVLVGFREKHSNFLLEMDHCEVLDPKIGQLISELSLLVAELKTPKSIPQIEVAVGDTEAALVFRNIEPISDEEKQLLIGFGTAHGIHIYLQPDGLNSIHAIYPTFASGDPKRNRLTYRLPDFGLEFLFHPTDFTQINFDINQKMVKRAIELLGLKSTDRVLDLFCGLGNFTLPIATLVEKGVGIEENAEMCERARENALHNNLSNVEFYAEDLYALPWPLPEWARQQYDAVLIDPPRTGALPVMDLIAHINASKVVYVSCNPATLARDVGILVQKHGFRLVATGIMDMFPHTTHVESIALLEK